MKVACVIRELHPRKVFRIARARRRAVHNVFLRLESDGCVGYGEAAPNAFYNETAELVTAKLAAAASFLGGLKIRSLADIERAWAALWPLLSPSRAAQCAVDLALWDWLAKREQIAASQLLWNQAPTSVTSFATIGLSSSEELVEKIDELCGFPRIKLKSDAAADLGAIRYLRAHSPAMLSVDANGAWSDSTRLPALAAELAALRVEFIEQPLPPGEEAQLPPFQGGPFWMADESCVTEADVERVAASYQGFNIKLVKCGGITPARRMLIRGQELGLKTMVGCMLESSALIAAGALLAQKTEYADLDGAWLLSDDPFRGWDFERGILSPLPEYGLGATPHGALFD